MTVLLKRKPTRLRSGYFPPIPQSMSGEMSTMTWSIDAQMSGARWPPILRRATIFLSELAYGDTNRGTFFSIKYDRSHSNDPSRQRVDHSHRSHAGAALGLGRYLGQTRLAP